MKQLFLLLCLFTLSFACYSQSSATRENITTLLELTGSGKLGVQAMVNMIGTFKKQVPGVPDVFWDEFMNDVKPESLIELIIPIYAKHYTDAEIVQLIAFYQTPLGKKVIETLPLISQESYLVGSEWGKKLSEQAIKKLKDGGYLESN